MVRAMEKYGVCRLCIGSAGFQGSVCPRCLGTGLSGDAQDYFDPTYALRSPRRPPKIQRKTQSEMMDYAVDAVVRFERQRSDRSDTDPRHAVPVSLDHHSKFSSVSKNKF